MNKIEKLARRVSKTQTEEESKVELDMLSEIRSGLEKIQTSISEDARHDERQSSLEALLINVSQMVSRLEAMEAEDDKAESGIEVERLRTELAECEQECEDLEAALEVEKTAHMSDVRLLGEAKSECSKQMAMCEAERNARIVAEQALATANAMHEKHMAMINQETPMSLSITPERDGADNVLRYKVTREQ